MLFGDWTDSTQSAYNPTLLDSFVLAVNSPGVSVANHNCFRFASLFCLRHGDDVFHGPCIFQPLVLGPGFLFHFEYSPKKVDHI